MATYIAIDKHGEQVNIVEIEAEQVAKYEQLTGLRLELPPEPAADDTPDPAEMEAALNELGVQTRE